MQFTMKQTTEMPMSRSEKRFAANRSTGQKNYVHARMQAEEAQARDTALAEYGMSTVNVATARYPAIY
jgi:hypothetical protein